MTIADNMHLPTGFFITLEGLEGSGKTTQGKLLLQWFLDNGFDAIYVNEPGGTPYGQDARKVFFAHHETMCAEAEIGLLLTCKAQLINKVIEPSLLDNKIVICDRFTDTLYAYQAGAKGHSTDLIDDMLNAFRCELNPDYTLFFHVNPTVSVERAEARRIAGGEYNSMDSQPRLFHEWVLNGFRKRFDQKLPKEYAVIDGTLSVEEIHFGHVVPRVLDALLRASNERQEVADQIPDEAEETVYIPDDGDVVDFGVTSEAPVNV